MADFEIKVDYDKLNALTSRMGYKVEDLFEKGARATAAGATANTVRVDTGLMKNSWDAHKLDRFEWLIGDFGCGYAIFHELGTRFLSATPMLYPAFKQEWSVFVASLSRAGVLL